MQNMSYEDAFLEAHNKYADAIWRHCYFRVFDRERAKELVQETFLKTWQYLASGREIGNLRAFLYRVANNLVIDESRKRKEISLEDLQEQGFEPGFEDHQVAERAIDRDFLLKLMNRLDQKYRDIIIMRYLDDFSLEEISEITGETANNISVRIHRGIKQIREFLEAQQGDRQHD